MEELKFCNNSTMLNGLAGMETPAVKTRSGNNLLFGIIIITGIIGLIIYLNHKNKNDNKELE